MNFLLNHETYIYDWVIAWFATHFLSKILTYRGFNILIVMEILSLSDLVSSPLSRNVEQVPILIIVSAKKFAHENGVEHSIHRNMRYAKFICIDLSQKFDIQSLLAWM